LPPASCARLAAWPNTSPLRSARFSPVAARRFWRWRHGIPKGLPPGGDPQAVLRAVCGGVESSLDCAGQPGHAVCVAVADGRVAGVVTVCERAHLTGQVDAYVGELAVAAGPERRGIATQLMDAAEAWAARRGLAFLTLETGAANQPARGLWAGLGQRPHGRWR
jgi:ribosomal protein S18 acetylase RimI-like enzyme